MENLLSYLSSRYSAQRVSIFSPINDIDAMVLARISYLPLHKIKLESSETVDSICEKMFALSREEFAWPPDYDFIRQLALSKRFKKMRVTDFVRKNSKKIERQFSAVTIHTTHYEMYLSFFGTDDTLIGWKEDFNLAFLDVIPAQIAGAEYLAAVHKKYPAKLLRLGGHSKGGNIAMYAAVTAKDSWQRRMMAVYNFDGPGLRKGTAALDTGSEKVIRKIKSFIPQGSIIGRLFEHREKVRVVKSHGNNLYQHDIYTWEIKGKNIVASTSTKASDLADKTITNWLESASQEEQKIFVNSLFKVFASANVNTPLELKAHFIKFTPTLLKAYRDLPKEKRKVIIEVWKKLAVSFMKARK